MEPIDADDEDHVVVACAGGSAYRARIVVGADGLHSAVRRTIHLDQP